MNDLISRKAVIELIDKRIAERKQDGNSIWLRNDEAIDIQSEVESLPTAYDVDKVVKQLDRLMPTRIKTSHENNLYIKKDDVIEILEGAVKNE